MHGCVLLAGFRPGDRQIELVVELEENNESNNKTNAGRNNKGNEPVVQQDAGQIAGRVTDSAEHQSEACNMEQRFLSPGKIGKQYDAENRKESKEKITQNPQYDADTGLAG